MHNLGNYVYAWLLHAALGLSAALTAISVLNHFSPCTCTVHHKAFLYFADDGSGGGASQPTPSARASPSPSPNPASVDLLLMSDNEPSLLISIAPLDPTPALLPLASEGGGPTKPAPPQDGAAAPVVDREDSASPVPVKPERYKKKGPPPVPAPYAGPKRTSNEVQHTCKCRWVIAGWVGRERERERM